jgi:carboxypeptidase Taq
MWENFVGRSREFWTWALPHAQKTLGSGLEKFGVDDLFGATNLVQRSFIRVEADEATYNLHVMLRFGIERGLIKKELPVKDLPGVWNERFEKLLGVKVPDDRRGCLQDVHWSFGLIGYFPTYTLGNLYAAQFWEKINADLPDLKARISRGDFALLLAWLREKIHVHGKRWKAGELCQRITGKPLSADPLLRHLEQKLRPLYRA